MLSENRPIPSKKLKEEITELTEAEVDQPDMREVIIALHVVGKHFLRLEENVWPTYICVRIMFRSTRRVISMVMMAYPNERHRSTYEDNPKPRGAEPLAS